MCRRGTCKSNRPSHRNMCCLRRNCHWSYTQTNKTWHFREDIWYATNMEIYEYTKAYESLVYSADVTNRYNLISYILFVILTYYLLAVFDKTTSFFYNTLICKAKNHLGRIENPDFHQPDDFGTMIIE